jgi:hypothetical protein
VRPIDPGVKAQQIIDAINRALRLYCVEPIIATCGTKNSCVIIKTTFFVIVISPSHTRFSLHYKSQAADTRSNVRDIFDKGTLVDLAALHHLRMVRYHNPLREEAQNNLL